MTGRGEAQTGLRGERRKNRMMQTAQRSGRRSDRWIRSRLRAALYALRVALVVLCLAAFGFEVLGQENQASSDITPQELAQMVDRGDKRAIPALEKAFQKATDRIDKEGIAGSLVRLGDKNEIYCNFLAQYARAAVENDMPFPYEFDADGEIIGNPKDVPEKYAPDFLAWCKKHGEQTGSTAQQALYGLPVDLLALAATGDSRGSEILFRGLESRNYYVATFAARGLARLQDRRAIKPIIQACERAPGMAEVIAEALVFFDDPEAQSAAARFIHNRKTLEAVRHKAKTMGPEGVFR